MKRDFNFKHPQIRRYADSNGKWCKVIDCTNPIYLDVGFYFTLDTKLSNPEWYSVPFKTSYDAMKFYEKNMA